MEDDGERKRLRRRRRLLKLSAAHARFYAEAHRGAGLTVLGACVLALLFGQPRVTTAAVVFGVGLGLFVIAFGSILNHVAVRLDLAADEEDNS